jgi:hypothetical protein
VRPLQAAVHPLHVWWSDHDTLMTALRGRWCQRPVAPPLAPHMVTAVSRCI